MCNLITLLYTIGLIKSKLIQLAFPVLMVFFSFVAGAVSTAQAMTPDASIIDKIVGPVGGFVIVIIISYYLYNENKKLREQNKKLTEDMIKEYKDQIDKLEKK